MLPFILGYMDYLLTHTERLSCVLHQELTILYKVYCVHAYSTHDTLNCVSLSPIHFGCSTSVRTLPQQPETMERLLQGMHTKLKALSL